MKSERQPLRRRKTKSAASVPANTAHPHQQSQSLERIERKESSETTSSGTVKPSRDGQQSMSPCSIAQETSRAEPSTERINIDFSSQVRIQSDGHPNQHGGTFSITGTEIIFPIIHHCPQLRLSV